MSGHIRNGSGGGNHISSPGGMHGGGSDHQHVGGGGGGGGGCTSRGGGGGSGHMVGIPDADGFIYDPRDADVLCGRGGAALRHPGNQTYRRLVSLNKGLYVTCLKTEKLKISRSIVAAIREQNGRFLEKDNDRNAWYDIGEKKAVEKTSQALREGAPKLRQKMAELNPYGSQQQQQQQQPQDIDPYDHLPDHNSSNNISYGQPLPSQTHSDVQLLAAAAERERLIQQQDLFRTERLLRQQSSSMGGSNHSSNHSSGTVGLGGLVAPPMQQQQQQQRAPQHGDLQPVVPGPNGLRNSMTSTTSSSSSANMMNPHLVGGGLSNNGSVNNNNPGGGTHSRHKDLQMDMMRRLSLHDMQQQIHATQQARRSSGLLNSRVSLARELGISESQLSLMSEFSTMSSSISGISGISGAGRPSMTFPSAGDNNAARSGRAISALTGCGVGDMDYVSSYLNGGASAAAYPQQLQQQQQLPQPANHNYSFRQQTMSAANLAAEAAAAVNGSDMDRRRVFAKMKYSRPPSVRSIKGQPAPTGPPPQGQHPQSQQQQSQHQGHSIRSIDDMPDFEMVESNLSLFSLSSKISLLDMKPAAAAAAASLEPNQANANLPHNPFGQNHQQQQQQQQQHHRPQHHDDHAYGAAAAHPYQHRVIVESALSNRSDFLSSGGSRHSIMSGLSKISDSSIDNSIFSDLSRKIGNVSTRSVAMSEMSVMDMQDMDDVLGDTRSGAEDVAPPLPPILPGGQQSMFLSSSQRQKPSSMDFDMLR